MFMDWKAHIFKIAIIPKLTYRFKTVLIKIPAGFFFLAETDKLILKFT